jgi:hypothetical protein
MAIIAIHEFGPELVSDTEIQRRTPSCKRSIVRVRRAGHIRLGESDRHTTVRSQRTG